MQGMPDRTWLVGDYIANRVVLWHDTAGLLWSHPLAGVYDCWQRPNGNIVAAGYAGIVEIVPDLGAREGGRILWTYAAPQPGMKTEVHSCQILPDGCVVTAEAGSRQVIVLSPQGAVLRRIPFACADIEVHRQIRTLRADAAGGYWLARSAEGLAVHLDAQGQEIARVSVPATGIFNTYTALPLADGGMLLSLGQGQEVREYDATGRQRWALTNVDLRPQGIEMGFVTGIDRLADGSTIVALYQGGTEVLGFQVDAQRTVVRTLTKAQGFRGLSSLRLAPGSHAEA